MARADFVEVPQPRPECQILTFGPPDHKQYKICPEQDCENLVFYFDQQKALIEIFEPHEHDEWKHQVENFCDWYKKQVKSTWTWETKTQNKNWKQGSSKRSQSTPVTAEEHRTDPVEPTLPWKDLGDANVDPAFLYPFEDPPCLVAPDREPPVKPPPQDEQQQAPPDEQPLCAAAVAMHGVPPMMRPMSSRQSAAACPTVHEDQEWREGTEHEERPTYPKPGCDVSANLWNLDISKAKPNGFLLASYDFYAVTQQPKLRGRSNPSCH